MSRPRARSHSSSSGSSVGARSMPGLDMMPIVLTPGMQQELAIAFSAVDRAVHQSRAKAQALDSILDLAAGGRVKLGVAHNASFADIVPAYFELGLYKNDHLAVRRQQWRQHRHNQR